MSNDLHAFFIQKLADCSLDFNCGQVLSSHRPRPRFLDDSLSHLHRKALVVSGSLWSRLLFGSILLHASHLSSDVGSRNDLDSVLLHWMMLS